MPTYHQSMFFHKDVFKEFGRYNLKYRLGAEFDIWQRVFLKHKEKILLVNCIVSVNNLEGLSNKNPINSVREKINISSSNISNKLILSIYKCIYFLEIIKLVILKFLKKWKIFYRILEKWNRVIIFLKKI